MCYRQFILALCFIGGAVISSFAGSDQTITTAIVLRERGDFKGADATLAAALKDAKMSDTERKELEWQRDRIERIRQDFSLTREQLFDKLSKSVRGLTRAEFDHWIAEE